MAFEQRGRTVIDPHINFDMKRKSKSTEKQRVASTDPH